MLSIISFNDLIIWSNKKTLCMGSWLFFWKEHFWLIDWWLINPLEFIFKIEGHEALDRNPGRDTLPYSYDWSQEIFIVHVPIGSSTHYPATAKLLPVQMHAWQGGSLYHIYDGLWNDMAWAWTSNFCTRGDTLTTKPSRCSIISNYGNFCDLI